MGGSRPQARPGRLADLGHHQSRPAGPLPPKARLAAGRLLDLPATLPGHVHQRHASLLLPSPASTRPPVQQRVKMIGALRDPDFQPVKRPPWTTSQYLRGAQRTPRVGLELAAGPHTPQRGPRHRVPFPPTPPFGACRRPACSRRRRSERHIQRRRSRMWSVEVAANQLPCLMPRRTAPSSSLRSSHARRPDNQRDRRGHRHRAIPLRRERSPPRGAGRIGFPTER